MTPRQKVVSRWASAVVTLVVVPLAGWGLRSYDSSKLDVTTFEHYVTVDSARHAFDSLKVTTRLDQIQATQARTDSTVRNICVAVGAKGC